MINHSCNPNAVKVVYNTSASYVYLTRYVRAGEELTISYCGVLEVVNLLVLVF
jgi:SET domain-containing protein